MKTHVSVTVVIITCNRYDKLRNTIDSLEGQENRNFEVIVVIDGSTDGTESYLRSYTSRLFTLQIINQENQGKSKARNRGASHASGELLIFIDDDMILMPGCIDEHIRHHENIENSICVGTQEDDPAAIASDFDYFRYQTGKRWERNINSSSSIIPYAYTYITAANFSIPHTVFQNIGGFDNRTDGAEDFDLAARAVRGGVKIYYNVHARAYHDVDLNCVNYISKQAEYYRSKMNILKIRPEFKGEFIATTPYAPSLFHRMVFFIVSRRIAVQVIDKGWLEYALPRFLRFRLYDFVITGLSKVYPERLLKV